MLSTFEIRRVFVLGLVFTHKKCIFPESGSSTTLYSHTTSITLCPTTSMTQHDRGTRLAGSSSAISSTVFRHSYRLCVLPHSRQPLPSASDIQPTLAGSCHRAGFQDQNWKGRRLFRTEKSESLVVECFFSQAGRRGCFLLTKQFLCRNLKIGDR